MADVEFFASGGAVVVNNTAEFSSHTYDTVDLMLSIDGVLFAVVDMGDGVCTPVVLALLLALLLPLLICEKKMRRKTAALDIFFVCATATSG